MSLLQQIRPFSLGVDAARLSREEFVRSLRGDRLILVALEGQPEALFNGLMECPTDENLPWHPRSESTGASTKILTVHRSGQYPMPQDFTAKDLADRLSKTHFVAPLRKRRGAFPHDDERITVGRSSLNDVVLCHPSVSKLHAWLEHDDRERLYLCDASSTNQTRVRGQIIPPNELVSFHHGDPLMFGEVAASVWDAGVVWQALNAE